MESQKHQDYDDSNESETQIATTYQLFKNIEMNSQSIRCQNQQTKESLQHNQLIKFRHINSKEPIDIEIEKDFDSDYDENEMDLGGLLYENFMQNKIDIKNPDDIVLQCSNAKIHYSYPCSPSNAVTFTIQADDEMKGFTRKELAVKAMHFFHLIYYIYQHYDTNTRNFIPDKGPGVYEGLFRPTCFPGEYENNGLRNLQYNKEKDYWEFICMEYI